MRGIAKRLSVAVAAALLALGASACGDGEDSTSPSSTTSPSGSGGVAPERHDDSGGGVAQFRVEGGDNSVQNFGEEVGGSEFDEAAAVLHRYLDARAAGNWAVACSYLAEETIKMLREFASKSERFKGRSCGSILAAFSGGGRAMLRAEADRADVGSLRVEGDRAFLLFHGIDETDYVIPLTDEAGRWKLTSVAATPLP